MDISSESCNMCARCQKFNTKELKISEANRNKDLAPQGKCEKVMESPSKSINLLISDSHPMNVIPETKQTEPSSKYSEFRSCGQRQDCNCRIRKLSIWERMLPRNSTYWPCFKTSFLLCTGTLPFIFLIVYIIVHFI